MLLRLCGCLLKAPSSKVTSKCGTLRGVVLICFDVFRPNWVNCYSIPQAAVHFSGLCPYRLVSWGRPNREPSSRRFKTYWMSPGSGGLPGYWKVPDMREGSGGAFRRFESGSGWLFWYVGRF